MTGCIREIAAAPIPAGPHRSYPSASVWHRLTGRACLYCVLEGVATMSALFEFCVTDLGELLSAETQPAVSELSEMRSEE